MILDSLDLSWFNNRLRNSQEAQSNGIVVVVFVGRHFVVHIALPDVCKSFAYIHHNMISQVDTTPSGHWKHQVPCLNWHASQQVWVMTKNVIFDKPTLFWGKSWNYSLLSYIMISLKLCMAGAKGLILTLWIATSSGMLSEPGLGSTSVIVLLLWVPSTLCALFMSSSWPDMDWEDGGMMGAVAKDSLQIWQMMRWKKSHVYATVKCFISRHRGFLLRALHSL